MTGNITASLFGTFRLQHGADDIRPRSRKTCGLLAYVIAADRRSAPRARLADVLWSDRGDQQAGNSLRQALRELRTGPIGAAVDFSRADVALPRDLVVSDGDRLEALAKRGDCDGVAAVLSGIDGDYLDDLDGLSPAFDEWLQIRRAHQRDWLFAASLACAAGAEAGRPEAPRALLGELARLDPLNEAVVRMRLRLDHAAGDVAAVHRHYRRLSNDLSRELSVGPSRETRDLLASLVGPLSSGGPTLEPPAAVEPPQALALPAIANVHRTPPVVAVVPFADDGSGMSGSIAGTISDAVCVALSRSSEFRVVPVETVAPGQLAAMQKRAVAAYSLRGSVRTVEGATVVTAHFSNTETGFLIWSEQRETGTPDRGWVETAVARIAGAVGSGIENDHASDLPPLSDGAYDAVASLYSRGKRCAREGRTLAVVEQGIALLDRTLELDPRHVGARLRLVQLYNTDCHYLLAGHDFRAMRAKALALMMEAVEIEPASARVRLRLAWCRLRERDWSGAAALFNAAEAATLHDPDAINECGFGLAQLGETDAARELIQRAFRLNPFAPAEYHADFAVLLALVGEHAQAEAHFEVCGEQRLFWQVIRLSNLVRLDRSMQRLLALQERFVRTFLEIWVRPVPPGLDDVLEWSATTFCFQQAEHRRLITDGITSAWRGFASAAAGNSLSAADAAAARLTPPAASEGRRGEARPAV